MLLVTDGRLDDNGVESVGDQADDEVVLGHLGVQRLVVGHIERDGVRVLDALGELLGRGQGAAGCMRAMGSARQTRGIKKGWDKVTLPTVTGMPESLRISSVGRVTKPAPSMSTFLEAQKSTCQRPVLKMTSS